MKTKYWIWILCGLLALCLGLSAVMLLPGEDAAFAEITSGGEKIRTVDLRIDQVFTVTAPQGGHNVVTVKDGKIGVTEADCPDHYCMKRGFCAPGTDIVCLPNKLVIHFLQAQTVDAAVG